MKLLATLFCAFVACVGLLFIALGIQGFVEGVDPLGCFYMAFCGAIGFISAGVVFQVLEDRL